MNNDNIPSHRRKDGDGYSTNTCVPVAAERETIIKSINRLGRHVPQCVLRQLNDEIRQSMNSENGELNPNLNPHRIETPHATEYRAALLFIDMSGFTKISQQLDVESLSKAINSYFQAIVDEVTSHGGDILKFAGDAIFAEWRVQVEEPCSNGNPSDICSQTEYGMGEKKKVRRRSLWIPRRSTFTEQSLHDDQHSDQQRKSVFARRNSTTACCDNRRSLAIEQNRAIKGSITLEDCVHKAAICGAKVIKKCTDYPIYAKTVSGLRGRKKIASLNVHCGLGVGKMVGVHVGNECNSNRREYLVFGNPIDQVAEACDSAELGELRASAEALKCLRTVVECKIGDKSAIIASGKRMFFNKRRKYEKIFKKGFTRSQQECTTPLDNLDNPSLKLLQKKLSLYVHPVVVAEDDIQVPDNNNDDGKHIPSLTVEANLSQSSSRKFLRQSTTGDSFHNKVPSARQRLRSEAELRSVFTIFIMPKIAAKLTDDPEANKNTFRLLNDIMNVVASILEKHKGHLRQYIVDDKGVVLIATFGLRGSTFPEMVSERALPTCRLIHSALTSELGVDSQIGATLGKVYCGVVGGVDRHEYAVLGPSVNLSARLMAQKNHPGVLVDNVVRSKGTYFNFIAFPPVKAKGYTDLVPVFKPLTVKETQWGKVTSIFVGRKNELERVYNLAVEMSHQEECPSKMFIIWGETGVGKSSFVVQAIAKIHKTLSSSKKSSIITRNVSSNGEELVPFSLLRSIFHDALGKRTMNDEESLDSSGTSYSHDGDYDCASGTMAPNSQKTFMISRLHKSCEEMNAPSGFAEIVEHYLFGNSKLKMSSVEKAPEIADIVSFMAQAFIRLTSHLEIMILALDDVQWVDNLSWKVLRIIFEEKKNMAIVCCARPLEEYALTIDDDFWDILTGRCRDEDRYHEMFMKHLSKSDIREMAALTLRCEPDDILDKYIDDIYTHSDGMPYYASEILENCMRNNLTQRRGDNKIGWCLQQSSSQEGLRFTNLNELLLQRVDNLDDFTRKVLHFASVLGASFELLDIVEISEHILCILPEEKEQLANDISAALQITVDEGILDEILQEKGHVVNERNAIKSITIKVNGEKEGKNAPESRKIYSFKNSTWQQLILSLLLDSWKRDIHKHAAMAIEARTPDAETRDYRTNVKLFKHWKESENTVKAAGLALDIGQSYQMCGLNEQSIKVYEDALDMWRKVEPADGEDLIAGFAPDVLESLDEDNLVHLIKLLEMFGQAIGSISTKEAKLKSASAFVDALTILRYAPVSAEIKNRTFIFPIYSGMFFNLKYGIPVPYTENELVANFVKETKKHGDPVHYGRALAMQGETYHRQGKYAEAIESHMELKRVYDVQKHHTLIVASYASDRVGQNFGCTANCYMRLNQVDKAMEIVDHIITYLMPHMDLKNVHNSIITIFPAIWILKDTGRAEKAREIFMKFVLEPFREYFGEDGTTPFKPAFRGIEILLDLELYMEGKVDILDEEYYDWALDINKLECSMGIDICVGNFGRSVMSINAEVCLKLSKLTNDPEKAKILIKNGMRVAEKAMSGCDGSAAGSNKLLTAYLQIKPVYDEIKDMIQTADKK